MKINAANRQQLLTVGAISVIALWAADKLILSPALGLWDSRSARITNLETNVLNGQQWFLQRSNVIRGEWDTQVQNILPANVSTAYGVVIQSVDRWARASGVQIGSTRPQVKNGDDPSYNTLECAVDATGEIESIARFLYQIEQDPIGVKVNTVDITSRDSSGMQLTLALQLSFLQLNPTKP